VVAFSFVPERSMNLLVFGSTGPSGIPLIQQAVEQGHHVTAFARNSAAITFAHEHLRIHQGNILDAASVDAAVQLQDVVLSTLGVRKIGKNKILSDGTKNIINAMQRHNIRRFICETSLGVGDSRGQMSWIFENVFRTTYLRNIFDDKEIQEQYIRESNLDWTIVRPAMLTNGPRTGNYKVWLGQKPPDVKIKVSRVDVADFMLKQVADSTYVYQHPAISY
jgi:putative NADH-flavin reductase